MTQIVVNRHATDRDIDLMFGPLEPHEKVARIDADELLFEDVAVAVGAWPSRGQARKNGWSGRVPVRFGSRKLGKREVSWLEAVPMEDEHE